MRRPIILGVQNPYPGEALYPSPVGCAGWRLWQMSGMAREHYLEVFDRRNLWEDSHRDPGVALEFKKTLQEGDQVSLFPPVQGG